jgi:sugar phosphate isomerase/epimerase
MVDNRPDSQDLDALRSLQSSSGIDICSIHAPFLLASRKVWGRPMEKMERSIHFARELGSQVVIIHLPYFWQIEYARWLYHNINQLNREAQLTVAVENAIYVNVRKRINLSFYNNLDDLSTFNSLVFDTSHFAISHNDIFPAWERLRPLVKHIHLSNNYLKGFDDHELPHQGNASDGFDGIVTLELNPGSLGAKTSRQEVVTRLAISLEFCRTHFANGLRGAGTA